MLVLLLALQEPGFDTLRPGLAAELRGGEVAWLPQAGSRTTSAPTQPTARFTRPILIP